MDTNLGLKLLKEVQLHEEKIFFIHELQEVLYSQGFNVDRMIYTKDGDLYARDDHKKYIVKDWTEGREIFFNDKEEVFEAARVLAKMHLATMKLCRRNMYDPYDKTDTLTDALCRHNKELIRIRNSIKRMGRWSEFELLYLECFDTYYIEAKKALNAIHKIYEDVVNQYKSHKVVIHGQYNHHNIIFDDKNELHIINFEYATYHLPIMDLYSMLRKTLEKNDWDVEIGLASIDEYTKIFPLSILELELVLYLLVYPEKFWKISNYYFNLNKAWKPKQTLIKLKKLVYQEEKKRHFTKQLVQYIKDKNS